MDQPKELTSENSLSEEIKPLIAKTRKKRRRKFRDSILFSNIGIFVYCISQIGQHPSWNWYSFSLYILATIFLNIPVGIYQCFLRKRAVYGLEPSELNHLAILEDKRLIGLWVDLTETEGVRGYPEQVKTQLEKYLPLLTLEDAPLLTQKQKQRLFAFAMAQDDDLFYRALLALASIGDGETVHWLKRWRLNFRKPERRKALETTITAIETRLAADHSDAQLLRPSSPSDQSDTLLHPLTYKPAEDKETLLRVGHGKGEE